MSSNEILSEAVKKPKLIDGASAVLWHRTKGRLTDNDIAQTILLKGQNGQDEPLIYMGVWTPEWAMGQEIRTYAAISDTLEDEYPYSRFYKNFNRHSAYLRDHPEGEKLYGRIPGILYIPYETSIQVRVMGLRPGERTGHMIPTSEILYGYRDPDKKVTHRNNMYDLRYTGDFTKAMNGGHDSRFVTDVGSIYGRGVYGSSSECRHDINNVIGKNFTDGRVVSFHRGGGDWVLRTFVAEIPQP